MLISVIVPVYNAEKCLHKCLESIKEQSYKDLEIILVNDGSTDDSGTICEQYSQKDKRFIVIHKENGGVSAARNTGLKIAKGKYIGFVDPDDWIDYDMYKRLHQLIVGCKADLSMCGYAMEDIEGTVPQQTSKSDSILFSSNEALNIILSPDSFQGYIWNKLFSAEIIHEHPSIWFDNEISFGEDLLFCCEFISKCNKIIYDPAPYYHYIMHNSNTTRLEYSPKKLTLLKALEKIISLLNGKEGIEIDHFKKRYIHVNISLLMHGLKQGECPALVRRQLQNNLSRYRLSSSLDMQQMLSCYAARANVHLCYLIWNSRNVFKRFFTNSRGYRLQ